MGAANVNDQHDPEYWARKIEWMNRSDPHVQALGIFVADWGAGYARLGLRIRAEHLNFAATCHGGVLFSLADTAFGVAANLHQEGWATGINTYMVFASSAHQGDVVYAEAREMCRSRRLATYRVEVAREPDELLCVFTGTAYFTKKGVKWGRGAEMGMP